MAGFIFFCKDHPHRDHAVIPHRDHADIPLSPQIIKSAPEGTFLFCRCCQTVFVQHRKNEKEKAQPALFMILASPNRDHADIPIWGNVR